MRSISVGPVNDLSFIQSEFIKSVKSTESDNPKKPYCLIIEFHNGKSKMVYFIMEDEANRNLKKVKTEMQKVFKNNNFQKILPEIPKTKIRKNKKSESESSLPIEKAKSTAKPKAKSTAKPKAKSTAKPKAKFTAKLKAKSTAKPKAKAKTKKK
ncbi:MAG TPA: hypothetical protein PKA90_02350 [Ignavibacteria bacterium]|nr:hypothetical protein [Ignavibacteria bacterium]HMR39249.1 hypothetical protein [Ignavibacteria bacterium]